MRFCHAVDDARQHKRRTALDLCCVQPCKTAVSVLALLSGSWLWQAASRRCRVLEVVDDAVNEAKLADALQGLLMKWAAVDVTVSKYGNRRDTYILTKTSQLTSLVEDAQLFLSSIEGSRYACAEPVSPAWSIKRPAPACLHYVCSAPRAVVLTGICGLRNSALNL
jgi:hypothetical protein